MTATITLLERFGDACAVYALGSGAHVTVVREPDAWRAYEKHSPAASSLEIADAASEQELLDTLSMQLSAGVHR